MRRPLDGSLVLKSIASLEDVEHVAAFNALIHGPVVGPMSRELILHHPHTRPEHWLFVEDEAAQIVVSALCLIPWTWSVDGVTLRCGEMGIVGTHPDYRRRGLIRALDVRFKELLREGEYDLSQIQGIPYFYRQFGYEYALPLEGGWDIEQRQIPAEAPGQDRFAFRQATLDDLPTLLRLYDDAVQQVDIYTMRDVATWRYLLLHAPLTETSGEFWLVEDAADAPIGYFVLRKHGLDQGLYVSEASRLPHAAVMAVLVRLKSVAAERDKPFIRLGMDDGCPLISAARAWGAYGGHRYAWQIHIPDPLRLLRVLGPAFERRLAASPFAGLTEKVGLNLYWQTANLFFEDGTLREVLRADACDEGSIRLPPNLLAPLALGWRSWRELRECSPDVSIWGQNQGLVDVLFPKLRAFLYTIY